jgi:hypothetical protein
VFYTPLPRSGWQLNVSQRGCPSRVLLSKLSLISMVLSLETRETSTGITSCAPVAARSAAPNRRGLKRTTRVPATRTQLICDAMRQLLSGHEADFPLTQTGLAPLASIRTLQATLDAQLFAFDTVIVRFRRVSMRASLAGGGDGSGYRQLSAPVAQAVADRLVTATG